MHHRLWCRSRRHLENEFSLGPVRAAFADLSESRFRMAVPAVELRRLLDPRVLVSNVLQFSRLNWAGNEKIESILTSCSAFYGTALAREISTSNSSYSTTLSRLVYASRTNESPELCAHFRVSWNGVFVT